MNNLTVLYYTSNHLEETNPYFLKNTKDALVKAIGNLSLIVVSHRPVAKETFEGYEGGYVNLVAGRDFKPFREGRHHLNIYQNIMMGSEYAKTKYVAMAEDDILYSHSHFHSDQINNEFAKNGDVMLYDMNKVSLFTWTDPPIFSFRSKRKVVNQLIAPSKMLSEALRERFRRFDELIASGRTEEWILHYWGDLGRYENTLGVTVQPSVEFYSQTPSVVFTHPEAYGYLNHGKRKRHGDIKIVELLEWGKASDILKLWGEKERE